MIPTQDSSKSYAKLPSDRARPGRVIVRVIGKESAGWVTPQKLFGGYERFPPKLKNRVRHESISQAILSAPLLATNRSLFAVLRQEHSEGRPVLQLQIRWLSYSTPMRNQDAQKMFRTDLNFSIANEFVKNKISFVKIKN